MPESNPAALAFLAARQSLPARRLVEPVPGRAALEEILRVALRVPDHGKLEPWRLIVLTRPDFERLATAAEARGHELGLASEEIERGRSPFDRGRLAVAVIFSPKESARIPEVEQLLSSGALCMNLLTTAVASGWGANWTTGWPVHDAAFRERALGLAPAERVSGIIHIGTKAVEMPERPRPALDQAVRWGLG